MKKLLAAFVALFVLFSGFVIKANALSPADLAADTAVLIDFETGQVLYNKDMNRRVFPASTTKIMTCLVAVEQSYPGEIVTVSENAIYSITEPQSSHIALSPGEELPMDDALFALMMPSANDAANAVAEHVAGSLESFADMMNAKAAMIGCTGTNFTNAHGLHEPMHYTTALDMALITRYAAGDPLFMRYFGADRHIMAPTNLQPEERPFTNYQHMLIKEMWCYNEYVTGGKVGYTNPARHTMSTVASKDGRTLVAVVMGSGRDDKFRDTQKLLDFGFDEFTRHIVPKEEIESHTVPIIEDGETIGEVRLYAASDITFLLHNSISQSDTEIVTVIPESYGRSDRPQAYINITTAGNGDSAAPLLASVEFYPEVNLEADAVPALVSVTINGSAPANYTLEIIIAVSAITLTAFFLFFSRYRLYKRRKARLARWNKRRQFTIRN